MILFLLGLSMVFAALLLLHQSQFETKKVNYIMIYIIDLFVSHNALLKENEVVPFGKELMTCLCDVLWYVDGYQAVFAERAIPVPNLFQRFANYNLTQMSKHHKRRTANIFRSTQWLCSRSLLHTSAYLLGQTTMERVEVTCY